MPGCVAVVNHIDGPHLHIASTLYRYILVPMPGCIAVVNHIDGPHLRVAFTGIY